MTRPADRVSSRIGSGGFQPTSWVKSGRYSRYDGSGSCQEISEYHKLGRITWTGPSRSELARENSRYCRCSYFAIICTSSMTYFIPAMRYPSTWTFVLFRCQVNSVVSPYAFFLLCARYQAIPHVQRNNMTC